jgi:hypothetical protein
MPVTAAGMIAGPIVHIPTVPVCTASGSRPPAGRLGTRFGDPRFRSPVGRIPQPCWK